MYFGDQEFAGLHKNSFGEIFSLFKKRVDSTDSMLGPQQREVNTRAILVVMNST